MSKYLTQPHWLALDAITSQVDLDAPSAHLDALRVMVRALRRQLPAMPPYLVDAITTATRFLAQEDSEQAMYDARVALWRLHDETQYEPDDPRYGAIRAVICALYPTVHGSDTPFDGLTWFLEFWDRAQYDPEDAAEALRFVYGAGAPGPNGSGAAPPR